jgi:hypothetical protein
MMQLAAPKQNSFQKRVVQLDTQASERGGSHFPISSRLLRTLAATRFWMEIANQMSNEGQKESDGLDRSTEKSDERYVANRIRPPAALGGWRVRDCISNPHTLAATSS